jgi:hypothetical protein
MSINRFAVLGDTSPIFADSSSKVQTKFSRLNREKKHKSTPSKVPEAVIKQLELRKKYKYGYKIVSNGNIENNSTLYVHTGVAHPHQIEALFKDVIERAKLDTMFGENFECEFQVNHIRKFSGEYMAYAFVDLTNPKLYYALVGYNLDGSERYELIDDPTYVPPKRNTTQSDEPILNWADEIDDTMELPHPKIRKDLPPLITLSEYEYDEQQQNHLQTTATHGSVSVSPAFIIPGVGEDYDECSLYVTEVPADDHDFLYAIFSRYARTNCPYEKGNRFYPKINIRESNKIEDKKNFYAIVQYSHPYDAEFARIMLQKVRAQYNSQDINMRVRYAFKGNRNK